MVYLVNMEEAIKISAAILFSTLSVGGIIAAIVRFATNWICKRTLDHYNNKHANQLEQLKSSYAESLAKMNHELDKAKRRHYLYTQSQFEIYNSLWKQLIYTKRLADELWKNVDPQKLPSFADQIGQTKYVIEENMLLIEENHYKTLTALLDEFQNFQIGKQKLVEMKHFSSEEILANFQDLSKMIQDNGDCKERYDRLVSEIGDSFRKQLHG